MRSAIFHVMGANLNVRKIVTEEFKKEFRRLSGNQLFDRALPMLKKQFDFRAIQEVMDTAIAASGEEPLRKYHRNNLRYLAKYYAQTLNHQLNSAKMNLKRGMRDEKLLAETLKVFKSNPQCKVYH